MMMFAKVCRPPLKILKSSSCLTSMRRYVHVEANMSSLGISLPPAGGPKANYNMTCYLHDDTIFLSGHLPLKMDGTLLTGRLGADFQVEEGYHAARWCGLNIISSLKKELGDLDRVDQIVKIFGIVRSTDSFTDQHLVLNGASDVLMEVFGKDKAFHARSAIGSNSLPLGAAVEVEAIIRVKP